VVDRAKRGGETEVSETARILQDLSERVLGEQCSGRTRADAERGAWPRSLWAAIQETGLTQAGVPESVGGAGASLADAMTIVRAAGRHAAPVPLVESILGNWLMATVGWAPSGAILTVPALAGQPPLRLTGSADAGWRLTGSLEAVPWGADADAVILLVRSEQGAEMVVQVPCSPHVVSSGGQSIGGDPRARLVFEHAAVSPEHVRPAGAQAGLERFLALGALCRCEQMVGALHWMLDATVAYAGQRSQFGRPIAGFQAVQHLIAVLAGHVSAAVCATNAARLTMETPVASFAIAHAKARVGEAAGEAAAIAHQVHGAIGYSHEYPLHYRSRRLWAWREEFGGERFWQIHVGRTVAARGSGCFWPDLTDLHASPPGDRR
jgi:alkylation response protein AidB-like acyl-CoA dehydrogenase